MQVTDEQRIGRCEFEMLRDLPGRIAKLGALIACVLALAAPRAEAAEIEDIVFADEIAIGTQTLPLQGVALLRYKVIFRGYVGALYLQSGVVGAEVLSDVSKRLELEYFWAIDGSDFGEAAEEILLRELGSAGYAPLRERVQDFHRLYQDVEPGDRYSLSYGPGEGLALAKNGNVLGKVEGADFAAAYFGIWLGQRPIDEGFRDRLLDGSR